MILQNERVAVVRYCQRISATGLTAGTSGNVSVFNRSENLVAISPSAMPYEDMTADDVVVMDLNAGVVDGARRPSSEWAMHLGCYRERADLGAIVHTHSPQASTIAVMGWDLPAVHYMIAYSGRPVVRCAPYHLFGTPELARAAVEYLGGGYGCLLASHGVLAAGPTISHAFALAEQIEFCAGIYLRAKAVGEPRILSDEQIADVIARFALYEPQGQSSEG
jgi:L-fuculose-phosphate aldolase